MDTLGQGNIAILEIVAGHSREWREFTAGIGKGRPDEVGLAEERDLVAARLLICCEFENIKHRGEMSMAWSMVWRGGW
jgi:hypothetical protein